jgi:glutathione S-transferase
VHVDLTRWPVIAAYLARVGERPKVKEAMHAEGLK